MNALSLISLAGGVLISFVFYDELEALGELIGTAIGKSICLALFGETGED